MDLVTSRIWWERSDLRYQDNELFFGQQNLSSLARAARVPAYVYNASRIRDNLDRLRGALESSGLRFKIFYALKANRYLPIVTYLRLLGRCGIDVCSPAEMLLARQVGFHEEEITYTGTAVSDGDIEWLARHPRVRVNCDSISSIRRLGERCPGRPIGIRINPQLGAGYHQALRYAGEKATKFGIYQDRYLEALALARRYDLSVRTLHFHCGSGYLTPQLELFEEILQRSLWFLDQCPEIEFLDIGGGMGVPLIEGDKPLDLARWGRIIARQVGDRDLEIHVEPGDYLVKDAGVLLVQVNTVEKKGDTTFIGVNAGLNIQNLAVYYSIPFVVAPLKVDNGDVKEQVTIAGNINEAIDLFAENVWLPPLQEGDFLALLNVGGYGSSSSSNHCMRGQFAEYILFEEDPYIAQLPRVTERRHGDWQPEVAWRD
ncbi:MAG TPA: diaminopimelate decarboxylase [Anaerolineae bacterium]